MPRAWPSGTGGTAAASAAGRPEWGRSAAAAAAVVPKYDSSNLLPCVLGRRVDKACSTDAFNALHDVTTLVVEANDIIFERVFYLNR